MTTACAIYARISQDELGLEKGVQRQLEDTRLLAQQRGWTVTGEYIDNDVSAWNGNARKEYQRLMTDAEDGRFERILVYMTSRLWRNRAERGQAINRLGKLRIGVAAVRGPELDLSLASGRMLADVLGSMDTLESEQMSERIVRATFQRAQEGTAHGQVLYGWRREYKYDDRGRIVGFEDVEDFEQAEVVREIARRILSGNSMHAIITDLRARGVPAPMRDWTYAGLKSLLLRPANVGQRVYRGQILGKAAWPPILDEDVHERVRALLKHPDRRLHRDGARYHLLTGGVVAFCGVCGGSLSTKMSVRKSVYRCVRGCVMRNEAKVDSLVDQFVVAWMARPSAAAIFATDSLEAQEAREKVQALRSRLDGAADEYADGSIDAQQLSRITARLRPEIDKAEEEAKRHRPLHIPDIAYDLLTERAVEAWESLSVQQKRAVLEAIGVTIVLKPRTKKGGVGFEPEDVEFRL